MNWNRRENAKEIGDMLEDDVEHIHQLAAKIEAQTSKMKVKINRHLCTRK
jgi:hypothetical protein